MEEDCLVCGTNGKGNCRASSVTYELKCSSCGDVYVGETGRNAYVRGKEHLRAMDKEQESSVLHKHHRDKHQCTVTDYTMS